MCLCRARVILQSSDRGSSSISRPRCSVPWKDGRSVAKPAEVEAPLEGSRLASQSSPRSRSPLARAWLTLSRFMLPAIVVAVFLAIWQWLPPALNIPTYELPNLSTTLQGLQNNWADLGNALLVTTQDALAGFLIGNALAILGATIFAYSSNMERAF